jgi:hypothetical protein
MKSNENYYWAAVHANLEAVRLRHLTHAPEDRAPIKGAYTYNCSVYEIARRTGLSVSYVRYLLLS